MKMSMSMCSDRPAPGVDYSDCSVLLFVIVEGGGFIIIYHSIIGIYDLLV